MAFSGIGKLIKELVTGTPVDTDYFVFGNSDMKKITLPNLKKTLGVTKNQQDLSNKIIIGSDKDTSLVVTNQNISFEGGIGTLDASSIASAYLKTIRNAIVQLKTASSAVVTGVNVSNNILTIKCSNLTGTKFEGTISASILIFMS